MMAKPRARLGQPAGQHVEGGAVQMADPDGAAAARGHSLQLFELAGDRGPVAPFVVEEDVALGVAHAGVRGHGDLMSCPRPSGSVPK